MRITKITELGNHIYAHVCPICGEILASTTEKDMMPEFSFCQCEQKEDEWKYVTFKTFGTNKAITMILHNPAPSFGYEVDANGKLIDNSDNHFASDSERQLWEDKALEYIKDKQPVRE